MKVLCFTHKHGLLPFAWRLKKEGNDTEVIVVKDNYERAWDGRFGKVITAGNKRRAALEPVIEAARGADVMVLTDHPRWTGTFHDEGVLYLYGRPEDHTGMLPPVRLGGWFDGEGYRGRHLLVADLGLWPGGLGAAVEAGATLVRPEYWPDEFEDLLGSTVDPLKSTGFRGLVQVGLGGGEDGALAVTGVQAGWPWLQTHAFVGALDEGTTLTSVLTGSEPRFAKRYTVVAPVTATPWPVHSADPRVEVEINVDPAATAHVFFHDMQVVDEGHIRTAGLDGLVGVVRGCGNYLGVARQRTVELAAAMNFPQKQFRHDVGSTVDGVLARFDEVGWGV